MALNSNSNSSLTGSQNNQAKGGSFIVDQSYEHFSNEPKSIVVESEEDLSDGFVDLTEEAQQEGLNSEIKLNFPLNESFYNTLRADKSSDQAMHADLLGTSFVINKQKIDRDFILRLHGQYNHLILLHGHHSFAMQIFTEMFKHVRAKTPNDLILKELVTNCNGYNGSFHRQLQKTFIDCGLVLRDTEGPINIECNDSNCVSIKYNPSIPVSKIPVPNFHNPEEKICELNCSLEFTLKSQNGEIKYTKGKVELIIPKKLTNYSNNVNILIDKIKEHFLDTGKFMGWFSDLANKVSRFTTNSSDSGATNSTAVNTVNGTSSKESSSVGSPENFTFSEITDILNKAKDRGYNRLDEIIKNLPNYKGAYVTDLEDANFKEFCSQQLNLKLQTNSKHQHIFGNILNLYKFSHAYSVKELILLAIAANDTLTEQHQDILFSQENFNLLQLAVCGQKYIEIFIKEFPDLYPNLKDQAVQLNEFNKISFFSCLALREEKELWNVIFAESNIEDLEEEQNSIIFVKNNNTLGFLNDLEKVLKGDPLDGVLDAAALAKNEEFITKVLSAFERDVSNQTKQDLLKNSFITLLAAAISQVHDSIVEHLCTKYTEGKHPAIQAIYTEAFANDKVVEQIKEQILKEINSSNGERKNKARKIYNLILESASNAGNVAFIEKILDLDKVKNDSQLLRESLVTVLNKTENSSVIKCLHEKYSKKYSENIISELKGDKIEEHFSDKKGEEVVLETPAQSTLTQIQGIADFAIEFTTEVVKEGCEEVKKFAEAGCKAMFDLTKVQEQEEESMISSSSDEYHEVTPPMAFADVKDILDKAKQGDYEKLDAILSNKSSEDQPTKTEEQKEESINSSYNDEYYEIDVLDATLGKKSSEDQLITDLNDENFKNFCSQYLNLGLQREEHENLLYKYQTENTYLVKELMLLAIVANEELTEKYSKDIQKIPI